MPSQRPTTLLLFTVLGLLFFSCLAFAQTGDKYCNSYICVSVLLNNNQTCDVEVEVIMAGPGWVGFGVGTSMLTADLTVLWANPDSSVTVSRRKATGYVMPQPVANQSVITPLISIVSSLETPTFKFRRPQAAEGSDLNNQQTSFVWSYATAKPAGNAFDSTIYQHINQGAFTLNLNQATVNGIIISSNSGPPPLTMYDRLVYSHGTIMFFSWGILVPSAIFVAHFFRHVKNWVKIHQNIQIFGTGILTFVGFWLGFVQSNGSHLRTKHQIIGVTIFICMFVQIFLGVYIHLRFDSNRTHRPVRNWLHRLFGPCILGLAFAQIPLGLQDYGASMPWSIAFYVWLGVLAALYVGLSFWSPRERVKKEMGSN